MDRINSMPRADALAAFKACCGSTKYAEVARLPRLRGVLLSRALRPVPHSDMQRACLRCAKHPWHGRCIFARHFGLQTHV